MAKFGRKEPITFQIGPLDATSSAVDATVFVVPDTGTGYIVADVDSLQSTASSSGTITLRKITDTSAPGASAGTTVVELTSAISTSSTANTRTSPTIVSNVVLKPGDHIARKSGGTQTNLVGFVANVTLEPTAHVL